MAILKSVVDVNNGNTGWTNSDVTDALETVFANLGFHGGSASSGVPQRCVSPGGSNIFHESWRQAGGNSVWRQARTDTYTALSQGTSAYRMLRNWYVSNGAYSFFSSSDSTNPNAIYFDNHTFTTGQALHWAPGGDNEDFNVNGLTLDTVYYVIVQDSDYIKLAANATDAANGIFITLSDGGWSTNRASKSNSTYSFRDENDASFDNRTINIHRGDTLRIFLSDSSNTGNGNFHFCYDTDDYDANKYVVDSWSGQSGSYTNAPTGTGSDTGTAEWDTFDYIQSFTDPVDKELFSPTDTLGSRKYIYANDTNSGMKGVVNVLPQITNRGNAIYSPFWEYEVPASGGRSALKLRVYRYQSSSSSYYGRIGWVEILNKGTGWTNNESFTIPGTAIGGVSPENDIVFGTRTSGSTSTGDGISSLQTTNLGAGSNFFQKANNGRWAVLKNVNDAAKTYGTTYYSFGIDTNTNNRICFNSGSGYNWLNKTGVQQNTESYQIGEFVGQLGLDRMDNYNYPLTNSNPGSWWDATYITYCSSSTPTAYPLEIRVYRAQAPQDTNFAIIQFCQTINNVVQPYGAFTIYRGATFGSNVWDLDYVYNGSMMIYGTGTRQINLIHTSPGNHYGYSTNDRGINEEPVSQYSVAREAFYGYLRDPSNPDRDTFSEYVCNIETDSGNINDMYLYYRNSVYDQHGGNAVAAEADYYKPIKGLPINERMVPCPYYLPDDFVMLQVSTTPGLTQFRTGDTVTIGGTETYEIIRASYQTQQNGLDGIDNNSTIGMLFLARIS